MDGFTLIDGVVAGIVIMSGLLAFARGFLREMMSILGWIVAAVVAFMSAGQVEPLVKELPVVGGFLEQSCELAVIASFAAVFAVVLVVVSIFTPLLSGMIKLSPIGALDSGLGFVFGVARGILLIAIALIVYEQVMVNDAIAMVEDSRTMAVLGDVANSVEEQIPEDATGWIVDRYEELVGDCAPGGAGDSPARDASN